MKKNDISAEINYVANVCQQLKERATFIKDMWSEGKYYFQPPKSYDDKVIRKKWDNDIKDILNELKIELTELVDFSAENIETVFKLFLEKKKIYNLDITESVEKDPLRNKGINYKTNEIYLLCSKNRNNIYKYKI